MVLKKKRKKEEARIREAMERLMAAARARSERTGAADLERVPEDRPRTAPRRTRGPQKAPTKQPVSIRLDRDIVAELRRTGKGWQTRLNDMLRDALALDR